MQKKGEGGGKAKEGARRSHFPTLKEIEGDRLTQLSKAYWSLTNPRKAFDAAIIEDIYKKELEKYVLSRIMMLEFSCYLENYLWPNFDPKTSSSTHVLSIIVMVNEKFRDNVNGWACFRNDPEKFHDFFARVLALSTEEMSSRSWCYYIVFMVHCFESLETEMVQKECLKLVSLPLWRALSSGRLQRELSAMPKLSKHWRLMQKKAAKEGGDPMQKPETAFFPRLLDKFLEVLARIPGEDGTVDPLELTFCERFMELMIDLMAELPTRRFFLAVFNDRHMVVKCRLAQLSQLPQGRLFNQLLDLLKFYQGFEIDEHTGLSLTNDDITTKHCSKILVMQRIAFKYFPKLRNFSLLNVGAVESRASLSKHFRLLSEPELRQFAERLKILGPEEEARPGESGRQFLTEVLVSFHEVRLSQLDAMNELPLYPSENILWDTNVVPSVNYTGEGCLALPKLNLQFLTFHDYLLRNFNLFRLESTYEIREDMNEVLRRMNPRVTDGGATVFSGWSRMAKDIEEFKIVEVAKPNLGENKPAHVLADVRLNLATVRPQFRQEWFNMHQHDVVFLLTVRPMIRVNEKAPPYSQEFDPRDVFGLVYVRGAEVVGQLDPTGEVCKEGERDPKKLPQGDVRTLRLQLDTNQYQMDMANMANGSEDVYATFNLLVRRKPKENNFKAVLECIRDLMNTKCVVPDWLHDIFLGYGDPGAAHYSNLPEQIQDIDFNDTFLDREHVLASFPSQEVKFSTDDEKLCVPPFKIHFPPTVEGQSPEPLQVTPYLPPDPGPYPQNIPKKNPVRFTPVQVEAIKSGVNQGLTHIVGPPGTGKTDVAVQIISNLYHTCPEQRTLLVTHSNQALNDLFEKIMVLDIHERHLLRLGHGEEGLSTDKDFSKFGRVNYMLSKRLELLEEVGRLSSSIDVLTDVNHTCESSGHFYRLHVLSRWEKFLSRCQQSSEPDTVKNCFPFVKFFENAPKQPLFLGTDFAADMRTAEGCWRHLEGIFTFLKELQAFEILRNSYDRGNYLLTRQAKIIAMTCTHAALKRRDLVRLGFQYDNLLMEESAQILEIETFIPMLLQNQDLGCRLKRVVLIGDHNQLPPVVKNMAFQKFCHLDQSLYTRFVRLGVPHVQLNLQGRARPSIAALYNWRYKELGDLPRVLNAPEYIHANAGFAHDYQFINVEDYDGVGESEPSPHFFQNLGEAEYVVATFQYMRLLGYPADQISILTTYNGQKHLIRDVLAQRCAPHPYYGLPSKVTTVDRFQGQQNNYILLSLVRSKIVGHVRDVRRLVVAVSRARLGLYIFGRQALYENCYELAPAFSRLLSRPTQLEINLNEEVPTTRKNNQPAKQPFMVTSVTHMGQVVAQREQQLAVTLRMRAQLQGAQGYQQQQHPQMMLPAGPVHAAPGTAAAAVPPTHTTFPATNASAPTTLPATNASAPTTLPATNAAPATTTNAAAAKSASAAPAPNGEAAAGAGKEQEGEGAAKPSEMQCD